MSSTTTLTLNPSLDRTFNIDELVRAAVIRVRSSSVEAAGKGVNVARALATNGHDALAVIPIGGAPGTQMAQLLDVNGPPYEAVPIAGSVRSNLTVIEADGTVTKMNEPGPELSTIELSRHTDTLLARAVASQGWAVLAGSLPPGAPPDTYARIVAEARLSGVRSVIDTSGEALRLAVGAKPHLIKPNRDELEELTGSTIDTVGEAADAATELHETGIEQVLVSLGADGALLVDDTGLIYGKVSVDHVVNTIGAGDTLLAGFLTVDEPKQALAAALAWARAAIRSPFTTMADLQDSDHAAVSISDHVESDRVLTREVDQ